MPYKQACLISFKHCIILMKPLTCPQLSTLVHLCKKHLAATSNEHIQVRQDFGMCMCATFHVYVGDNFQVFFFFNLKKELLILI